MPRRDRSQLCVTPAIGISKSAVALISLFIVNDPNISTHRGKEMPCMVIVGMVIGANNSAFAGRFDFLPTSSSSTKPQIAELARILDDLKIERAQVEVDDRRTLSEFADALGSETFDTAKASVGGERRVASAARLREVLIKSLQQIHAMLKPEQRTRLSYLIRTGVLSL